MQQSKRQIVSHWIGVKLVVYRYLGNILLPLVFIYLTLLIFWYSSTSVFMRIHVFAQSI